ncbi:LytTR family DNA-binding domain-containing protein [Allomuricauda sp. d1]|uniref:LytR/AlgR family response regulator transcription factor n=1 Tax=Allomuricauda sp. d1 TaxID=3136725 RepID=UPI0031E46554
MQKDRLYLLSFLAVTLIFILISGVAIEYFVKYGADRLLNTQLESSKREAKEIATFIGAQIENGSGKEQTIEALQNSISKANLDMGFISMFDWSGRIVCHPENNKVGQLISPKESFVSSVSDDLTPEDFYELLKLKREAGGIRDFEGDSQDSEVVYLYPVNGTDWMVAAHANIDKISNEIDNLRNRFYTILGIMGLVMILTSVIAVRLIGSSYEKRLEAKNQKLSDEVINLAKLNRAVGDYQQKVSEKNPAKKIEDGTTKKRILTYLRNELLPISIEEIAHIYTENTITYVVCDDGKRSTSNLSLDELFSNLDSSYFFRANRQFIIAISAIDKIVRYGNNQLKILVNPNSEVDIIISKNKAAEFKQWLNL